MATWVQEMGAILSYCATNSYLLHNRSLFLHILVGCNFSLSFAPQLNQAIFAIRVAVEGGGLAELNVKQCANSGKFAMISRSVSMILGMSVLSQIVLPPVVVITPVDVSCLNLDSSVQSSNCG